MFARRAGRATVVRTRLATHDAASTASATTAPASVSTAGTGSTALWRDAPTGAPLPGRANAVLPACSGLGIGLANAKRAGKESTAAFNWSPTATMALTMIKVS